MAVLATTTSTAADAATFSVVPTSRPDHASMTYRASPGERNRMTATFDLVSRQFVLTDPGAHAILPLPTGPNDITLSACRFELKRVTCVFPSVPAPYDPIYPTGYMWAELGDGDDTLTMDMEGRVDGGAGNDSLRSTAGADVPMTYGGVEMLGGDGGDRLIGGDGDDSLEGGAGADTLDGRDGMDSVGWGPESSVPVAGLAEPGGGVHVTLDDLPNDGHRGGLEGDNALDVEWVYGTDYADVIVGSAADEHVYANAGDDRVVGGPGKDVVVSGSGDDRIELRDGEPDRYSCEDGADVVLADPFDSFYWLSANDCETVTVEG